MTTRTLVGTLVLLLGSVVVRPVLAEDMLQVYPDHINLYDYGQPADSGVVVTWSTLRYLHLGDDSALGVNPYETLTSYARSLQPSGPYSASTLAATLNRFEAESAHNYVVFQSASLSELVSAIGYWLNRNALEAPASVGNLPVLVPLLGDDSHWAIVSGALAVEDPYRQPATTMLGLWIDDPAVYVDPNVPFDPNVFYSLTGVAPYLSDILQPMSTGAYAGRYLALVDIPEATAVPEPASLVLGIGLAMLGGCWECRRKSKRS